MLVLIHYGKSDALAAHYLLELQSMRNYSEMNVSRQVDGIRSAVRMNGFFIAGSAELGLCCDQVSEEDRTTGIEQIAEWEGWTFKRLPGAMVRFSDSQISQLQSLLYMTYIV